MIFSNGIKRYQRIETSYFLRFYHSYPDPNEKPKISSSKSSNKKFGPDKSNTSLEKFDMTKMFPGVPVSKGIEKHNFPQTKSTVIQNGLTIASQDMFGQMTSVAFIASVGSSYEIQNAQNLSEQTLGSTQMMELTAFRSTKNRTHQKAMTEIEKMGGNVQCISSKENILYCIDVMRMNIEPALEILADSILNPLLLSEEIEEAKQIAELQQFELPSEILSRDAVQRAGYLGSPLGNHHYCPIERIQEISSCQIIDFRNKYLFGQNCYLSGAGIEHEVLTKLADNFFKALPKAHSLNVSIDRDEVKKFKSISKSVYTGGMVKNERELKDSFIRIAVGFEVGGWHSQDLVIICLLQQLLGGGSSFSAGGPGKGMYTRLYTDVLNRHHWVESAEAFTNINEDSGMLGIDGACTADDAPYLIQGIYLSMFFCVCFCSY